MFVLEKTVISGIRFMKQYVALKYVIVSAPLCFSKLGFLNEKWRKTVTYELKDIPIRIFTFVTCLSPQHENYVELNFLNARP